MSVIVKGMEMPKNCGECFVGNRTICADDCPLIELPQHGRLIDADKLNMHDVSPAYGFYVMGVTEEDIELAETVIEAEGETDA